MLEARGVAADDGFEIGREPCLQHGRARRQRGVMDRAGRRDDCAGRLRQCRSERQPDAQHLREQRAQRGADRGGKRDLPFAAGPVRQTCELGQPPGKIAWRCVERQGGSEARRSVRQSAVQQGCGCPQRGRLPVARLPNGVHQRDDGIVAHRQLRGHQRVDGCALQGRRVRSRGDRQRRDTACRGMTVERPAAGAPAPLRPTMRSLSMAFVGDGPEMASARAAGRSDPQFEPRRGMSRAHDASLTLGVSPLDSRRAGSAVFHCRLGRHAQARHENLARYAPRAAGACRPPARSARRVDASDRGPRVPARPGGRSRRTRITTRQRWIARRSSR